MEDDAMVRTIREFNRTLTQRVGALSDHFLGRQRPLAESRLLWEIGELGCDVRALRSRLALDAGYVSRLLRSLEAAGLVAVAAGGGGRRGRGAGRAPPGRRGRGPARKTTARPAP